jgi:hypothetical protein
MSFGVAVRKHLSDRQWQLVQHFSSPKTQRRRSWESGRDYVEEIPWAR